MSFHLHHFHEEIKKEGIIFCYSGPISQATIEGIGQTLRLNMELEEAGFTTSQKVFSIFVEQMQNVLNHSVETVKHSIDPDQELRVGILIIGHEEGHFYIYCGNRVNNSDVDRLREKIEFLRRLDKEELKALYKMTRQQKKAEPERKGAGLGLIEMARRAGKPIEYSFYRIDEAHSFFCLKVVA
ncbi:hypothetical protein GTO91_04165 [Heliobacterium undosum]|uniref:ATP-binding protein n=1 Tax=Heliomicrobium undosum TaxID=121734 RepID=A0A845KZ19_9FIRM|nr:SiaB family protein kinase [Heliomicrobium undosum]MZP28903.1 hypothetical protein [Heliomicrobium undosum]